MNATSQGSIRMVIPKGYCNSSSKQMFNRGQQRQQLSRQYIECSHLFDTCTITYETANSSKLSYSFWGQKNSSAMPLPMIFKMQQTNVLSLWKHCSFKQQVLPPDTAARNAGAMGVPSVSQVPQADRGCGLIQHC